ncbi:cut9-interacting protein scn1 [Physcia stellaris]|nr:cut9-interacting protein scn1 [Physcia stellaris]
MANDMAWVHEILNALPQDDSLEVFPWHLGVFDAHCHPTDTPSCLDEIPSMKARVLTIMATRGEDQDVVVNFAQQSGIRGTSIPQLLQTDVSHKQCELIPSFGWHPWFSHQIYDDSILGSQSTIQPSEKVKHYRSVITPTPEDDSFLQFLPDPRPLSALLTEIRKHLQQYPYALVGEIGLDRTFRLPENWLPNIHTESTNGATPGGREGRRLSPYKVHMDHQRKILKAQLNLAGEMQRPVSVHGVAAHGILFEALAETWKGHDKPVLSKREQKRRANAVKTQTEDADEPGNDSKGGGNADNEPKPFPPRICLHSYSGPPDTLRQYFHASVPAEVYCSFSVLVNMKAATAKKTVEVIKAVPDERILVESDLHCAGEEMDRLLERMVRIVCGAKEWSLEEGVKQLGSNWFRFVFGREP